MAAQQLLTRLAVAAFFALLVTGPVVAQSAVMPQWVRVATASRGVAKMTIMGTNAIESSSREAPIQSALKVGDTLFAARNVYYDNARLLGSRNASRTALVGRYAASLKTAGSLLAVASTSYELVNGTLSASQAGRNAVQLALATTAVTGTYLGMIAVAGWVGTASTGTAIGTLTGAAYTSAATAWFGGGAVAAGGGGMAVGSVVLTGGTILVAAGVSYGVYKTWNLLDPAERDALNTLAASYQMRGDLTDANSARGAALLAEKRNLEQVSGRKSRN